MASTRDERMIRTQRINMAKQTDPTAGQVEQAALAKERLKENDLAVEAHLNTTAYLDYRLKSAYERTEEFMRTYYKWYGKKQEERRGRGKWVDWSQLSMLPDAKFTSLWRARQHADHIGAPYDRYILSAINRANSNGTNELPAPNQLYGDADLAKHVADELASLRAAKSVQLFPRDCRPEFYAENYAGHPVQDAALDAITAEVLSTGRSSQPALLAKYMREIRLISEGEARRRLGSELVEAALSERTLNSPRPDQVLDGDTVTPPGCFGYHQDSEPSCVTCPFAGQCIERAGRVESLLMERHGTTDIATERIRAGDRKRQQRRRDRKRAGATMTLQEGKRILRELGNPELTEKRLKAKVRRDKKKAKQPAASTPEPEGEPPNPDVKG